ncbi:MAG: Lon protease [Mycoplasmataceae bacterium]|nr:MAG: Lon protease [Mycoplasmataceae bacterium]
MEIEYKKKESSNYLKYILITGGIFLLGIIFWIVVRKNSVSQMNLGEQQRQQVRELSSQLVGDIIDNQNNLNQLTNSPDGIRRGIEEIEEIFLSSALSRSSQGIVQITSINSLLSSGVIEQSWYELRPFIIAALQDSSNSILENCRLWVRNDIEKWLRKEAEQKKDDYNKLLEKYLKVIQELRTVKELFEKYNQIRNSLVINKIDRSKELVAKGYSEIDVVQLRDWNLLDQDFPNLYDDKRIGVTNALSALSQRHCEGGKEKRKIVGGLSRELMIFLKPSKNQSSTVYFPLNKIEVAQQNSVRKIIKDLLNNSSIGLENIQNHDIYILRVNSSHDGAGPSSGVAHYLALYSALNKIPLPKNLASTATIKGERVGGIGGLQHKLEASVKSGIDTFILSCENKKDENHEQSFDDTPHQVESKIKQVHFISQVDQIKTALDEVLNETVREKVHICKKNKIPNKEPQEEYSINHEQFLSLATEIFSREVSKNQKDDFKRKVMNCCMSSDIYYSKVEEAIALRKEYLNKIEDNYLSSDEGNAEQVKEFEKRIVEKEKELKNEKLTDEEKQTIEAEIKTFKKQLEKLKKGEKNSNQRAELEKEYESKFQVIASSVVDLTKEMLTNLQKFGYTIKEINWTSKLKAPSLTDEFSVSFSLAINKEK